MLCYGHNVIGSNPIRVGLSVYIFLVIILS